MREDQAVSDALFDRHEEILNGAIAAIAKRDYWSAYPEIPSGKIYGETARKDGYAAFQARLNRSFALDQPGTVGEVGAERSPFGMALGITYPKADLDGLLCKVREAATAWGRADIRTRVGIGLEILHRLNRRSFEMANAVMHTTGQGFMMAFQAGGPHAQDRGLEAIAYAYQEMTRTPATALWEKRVSKADVVRLAKKYRIVPRGIGLVIGCSTFPTWNGYPGLFASLVTGNAVVVKPHPGAILPLAITVEICREVLREQGFDADVVTLVADEADAPITGELVQRAEFGIVDYTGGSEFGDWVERHAPAHAVVHTEKAGVNSAIIDSLDDLRAVSGNLAFSLCLYSGQMCTTTQNIFIPRGGVTVGGERKSFDEIAEAIVGAVNWLLSDPARASEVLGAIQNERTIARIEQAASEGGQVLSASKPVANENFPEARTRSPLIIKLDAKDHEHLFMREMFGPIVYLIATDNTKQSLELTTRAAREQGAITCAIYSTDDGIISHAEEATAAAGVALSCNLTGQIWVNQSAAFSDFHVSGANPAGNACLCDGAFVAGRFRVVQSRILLAQQEV